MRDDPQSRRPRATREAGTPRWVPATQTDPAWREHVRSRTEGDLGAAGPLPGTGALVTMLVPYAILAFGIAAMVAGLAAQQLSAAYARVDAGGHAVSLPSAAALVGGHPAIAAFWLSWLFGGVALGAAVERKTRRTWAVPFVAFAIGGLFALAGTAAIQPLLGGTDLGLLDATQRELAAVNLPSRWWLPCLVLSLGWLGGRRGDGILLAGAVVTAAYAAWEMDAARWRLWADAVETVFDAAAQADWALASDAPVRSAFRRADLVMHARAVTDLLLLLAPVGVVRTLTDRGLGAIGASNWRALRP